MKRYSCAFVQVTPNWSAQWAMQEVYLDDIWPDRLLLGLDGAVLNILGSLGWRIEWNRLPWRLVVLYLRKLAPQ